MNNSVKNNSKYTYNEIQLKVMANIDGFISQCGGNTILANFTASYIDWDIPTTSSYRFDSFVDLDITNMRTFSGDIYRIKIYGASDSELADFPVLLDTITYRESFNLHFNEKA